MMNKRIPTILGLFVLITGVVGGVFLVNNINSLNTRASIKFAPQNIRVSNITHDTFTVSWSTAGPATGTVRWGQNEDDLDNIAIDDQKKHTHYFEIENLSPSRTYYFQIYSNSKNYSTNQQINQLKTGNKIDPKPVTEIASGKVLTQTGLVVDSALVYANISGGNTLSDITTNNGGWVIPTSKMRSKDLSNYLKINDEDEMELFVDAGPLGTAQVKTLAKNANPVPPIILGKFSDFTEETVEFTDETPEARLDFDQGDVQSAFDFLFN